MKVCNSSEGRLQFSACGPPSFSPTCGWCLWATVSSVVFGNMWFSIHFPDSAGSTILYCQSRPSCPREPQPALARMKEMVWFPSTFHTSNGQGNEERTLVLTVLHKQTHAIVRMCAHICMSVSFKLCEHVGHNIICVLRNRWVNFYPPLLNISVDIMWKVNTL